MQNFKYCIWCLPEEGHGWNIIPKGFYLHMSIKTDMDLDEAFILFENIIKYPITVYLKDELVSTTQNGFNALFYKVGCEGVKPSWWPKDAHISFAYRYNKPFSMLELEEFSKIPLEPKCKLTRFWLVRCEGDYRSWKNKIVNISNN